MYFRSKLVSFEKIIILLIIVFVLSYFFAPGRVKSDADNVILIVIESLRPEYLQTYGSPAEVTDNLDELTTNGLIFKNIYIDNYNPYLGLMSTLSGSYPDIYGIKHPSQKLPNSLKLFSDILSENGFDTAAFISSKNFAYLSELTHRFNTSVTYPNASVNHQVRAEELNNSFFKWFSNNQSDKKFALIYYSDLSKPFDPPKPFDTLFAPKRKYKNIEEQNILVSPEQLYIGEMLYLDQQIGKLVKYLKKETIHENTLMIITSSIPLAIHDIKKESEISMLNDTNFRIPLILYGKDIPEEVIIKSPGQQIDILPTILDILNISTDFSMTGHSILSLVKNSDEIENSYSFSQIEIDNKKYAMLRDTKYKLVHNMRIKENRFYNIDKDISEKINLLQALYKVKNINKRSEITKKFKVYRDKIAEVLKMLSSIKTQTDMNNNLKKINSQLSDLLKN